jgi:hypothetical protein
MSKVTITLTQDQVYCILSRLVEDNREPFVKRLITDLRKQVKA